MQLRNIFKEITYIMTEYEQNYMENQKIYFKLPERKSAKLSHSHHLHYEPQMWNVMDELKKYCAKVTSCTALSICNKG